MSHVVPREQQDLLLRWLGDQILNMPRLSFADCCQLALCSRDLDIRDSHGISRFLKSLTHNGMRTNPSGVVDLALRQLVLMRFGLDEYERRGFLKEWIDGGEISKQDIVTVAYIMGIAAEQLQLLSPAAEAHAKRWFITHSDIQSRRVRAWFPRHLALTGHPIEAQAEAARLLREREKNGSWAGDLRATASVAYALAVSGLAGKVELEDTLGYLSSRLARGLSSQVSHEATVLKLWARLGLLDDPKVQRLKARLANEWSVFLSHSSHDKVFVRQLADDLRSKGVRVWLDEAEIRAGDSIVEKIESALGETRFLIVVLTTASVCSPWVKRELNSAFFESLGAQTIRVIPVLKEPCDIPYLMRDIKYADFRSDYNVGLETLCSAIEGER